MFPDLCGARLADSKFTIGRGPVKARGSLSLVLLLGIAVVLAGCTSRGQDDAESEVVSELDRPLVDPISGPPVFGPPVWTLSTDPSTSEPIGAVEFFSVDDSALSVAFPIVQVPSDARIDAIWSFEGTELNLPETSVSIDQDRREGWIAFSLTNSASSEWPDGSYRVALISGGVEVAAAETQILKNASDG